MIAEEIGAFPPSIRSDPAEKEIRFVAEFEDRMKAWLFPGLLPWPPIRLTSPVTAIVRVLESGTALVLMKEFPFVAALPPWRERLFAVTEIAVEPEALVVMEAGE